MWKLFTRMFWFWLYLHNTNEIYERWFMKFKVRIKTYFESPKDLLYKAVLRIGWIIHRLHWRYDDCGQGWHCGWGRESCQYHSLHGLEVHSRLRPRPGGREIQAVEFTRRRRDAAPTIVLEGEHVLLLSSLKYLDIHLKNKETMFSLHLRTVADKATWVMNTQNGLMSNVKGTSESKRRLLGGVVQSILLYVTELGRLVGD